MMGDVRILQPVLLLLLLVLGMICSTTQGSAVGHRQKRALNCEGDDKTKVFTPYLFVSTSTKDCATLIGAMVDYYDMAYRQTCQFWMGGDLPHAIDDSYISHCYELANGTTKYRAEVCCQGATTEQRCFTCDNSAPTRDTDSSSYHTMQCDYYSSGVQTCGANQVCMTETDYPRSSYGYNHKSCADREVCAKKLEDANCQSGSDPSCVTCCDTPYCNFHGPIRYLQIRKVCSPNPCAYGGVCHENDTVSAGYTCECKPGFSGPRCYTTMCTTSPCQNGGRCWSQDMSPYYICGCRAKYRGVNCEIACDLCAINVCQNGGTCYDHLTYGPRCLCADGWVGDNCTISDVQPCPYAAHAFTIYGDTYELVSRRTSQTCTSRMQFYKDYQYYKTAYVSTCTSRMSSLYRPPTRFQQGVNGNVKIHDFHFARCEKGDVALWSKPTVCCPACTSNPCQNGGWCLQSDKGHYTCKCRYGYSGQNCQFKEAICYASGDPHYVSFDKRLLHFQSPCKYTMVKTSNDSLPLDQFEVQVRHENRNGGSAVAYVKYVEVILDGWVIKMDKGKVVTVNGQASAAGATYPGFNIFNNGRFLRLETSFGLVVETDGDWILVVKVSTGYGGLLQGLCGNFDGRSFNDWVNSTGVDVQYEENAQTLFGNSWQVNDVTDPMCQNAIGDPDECEEPLLSTVRGEDMCGFILGNGTDHPLRQCVQDPDINANNFFESCVYDACANQGNEGNGDTDEEGSGGGGSGGIDEVVCRSIEAFATACKDQGFVSEWRERAGCGLDCPANSMYFSRTTACQATCSHPLAAQECPLPDTENCVCNEGYVLSNDECILPEDCGCLDDTKVRHEAGSKWLSADCATLYSCEECGDSCQAAYHIVEETKSGCPDAQLCQLMDGEYQCVSPGCQVNAVTMQINSVWQTSCDSQSKCTETGVVTSELPGCEDGETCTLAGSNSYECITGGCKVNGITYKVGSGWLSSACDVLYVCKADGTVTSEGHKCTPGYICKRQGELYACVRPSCKDEKGGIRQVGDKWTSRDCSSNLTCLESGDIRETTYSCRSPKTCEAGDLGKCVGPDVAWGEWGVWGACSGRCGAGSQSRYRRCLPLYSTGCIGDSEETRPCQCDQNFNAEDCDNGDIINNPLGYLPDACDCAGYIQCEKRVDGTWRAIPRRCAPCTEWDQSVVTCVHVNYDCTAETVANNEEITVHDGKCERGGEMFREHAADDKYYEWLVAGSWITRPCALGTYFVNDQCTCITDPLYTPNYLGIQPITCLGFEGRSIVGSRGVWAEGVEVELHQRGIVGEQAGYFRAGARVEITYFTNRIDFAQFSVSLWFKRTGFESGVQGLLSDGDCSTPSVEMISIDENTLAGRIVTQQGTATITGLKAPFKLWHHAVMVYTGRRFNFYLDNVLYANGQKVGGLLDQKHCPMMIGTLGRGLGFTGYIDQVCFYKDALGAEDVNRLYVEGNRQEPQP